MMYLKKEKDLLHPLPPDSVRDPYQLIDHRVRVDNASLFRYKGCQYSVPPEYIGRDVILQIYDDQIHVYCNTRLIALHDISSIRLNYQEKHYFALAEMTHSFAEENIVERARENLRAIGAVYE